MTCQTTQAQKAKILEHLQSEPISARTAWQKYGCMRLAARIFDLRQEGWSIKAEQVTPRRGNRFARYFLG